MRPEQTEETLKKEINMIIQEVLAANTWEAINKKINDHEQTLGLVSFDFFAQEFNSIIVSLEKTEEASFPFIFGCIADNYFKKESYENSNKAYLKAIKYCKSFNMNDASFRVLAIFYSNLSFSLFKLTRFAESLTAAHRSCWWFLKIQNLTDKDYMNLGIVFCRVGQSFYHQGRWSDIPKQFQRTIKMYQKIKNKTPEIQAALKDAYHKLINARILEIVDHCQNYDWPKIKNSLFDFFNFYLRINSNIPDFNLKDFNFSLIENFCLEIKDDPSYPYAKKILDILKVVAWIFSCKHVGYDGWPSVLGQIQLHLRSEYYFDADLRCALGIFSRAILIALKTEKTAALNPVFASHRNELSEETFTKLNEEVSSPASLKEIAIRTLQKNQETQTVRIQSLEEELQRLREENEQLKMAKRSQEKRDSESQNATSTNGNSLFTRHDSSPAKPPLKIRLNFKREREREPEEGNSSDRQAKK